MKIAVPYENGEICSHLAQVKEFLIFDVVDDEIISTKIVKQTNANDPGALVEFLKKENTAVLLCDALPIPMMIALRETSIQVLGGAKGAPKDRVGAFLNGWDRIHLISIGGDADAPPYSSSQTHSAAAPHTE